MAPQLWHQLLVLPRDFVVSVLPTPLRDPSQGAGEPRCGGLALDHPMPLPGAAPVVGKAQKLKGLRPSFLLVAVLLIGIGWSREPNHAGLVGMELQAVLGTAFREDCPDALRIPFGGTHDQRVICKTIKCHHLLAPWFHHLLKPHIEHVM
jgi:hypothetical protein